MGLGQVSQGVPPLRGRRPSGRYPLRRAPIRSPRRAPQPTRPRCGSGPQPRSCSCATLRPRRVGPSSRSSWCGATCARTSSGAPTCSPVAPSIPSTAGPRQRRSARGAATPGRARCWAWDRAAWPTGWRSCARPSRRRGCCWRGARPAPTCWRVTPRKKPASPPRGPPSMPAPGASSTCAGTSACASAWATSTTSRIGSPPAARRAATTPASSWPPHRRARSPRTTPARRSQRCGSRPTMPWPATGPVRSRSSFPPSATSRPSGGSPRAPGSSRRPSGPRAPSRPLSPGWSPTATGCASCSQGTPATSGRPSPTPATASLWATSTRRCVRCP